MPLEPANPSPQPINKKELSERDICSKFITPALVDASWDHMNQIREEVSFTKGQVIVRGKLSTRGEPKRADYPPGAKSYNKGKPIRIEEFETEKTMVGQAGSGKETQGNGIRVARTH